jgi:hypothetical protein
LSAAHLFNACRVDDSDNGVESDLYKTLVN